MSIDKAMSMIRIISRAATVAGFGAVAILAGTAAAMPGPVEVGRAAVDLAAGLPEDVTRLALTVAMALALINLALVAAMIALVQRAASKPCLLFRDDGIAVLGHAIQRAQDRADNQRRG